MKLLSLFCHKKQFQSQLTKAPSSHLSVVTLSLLLVFAVVLVVLLLVWQLVLLVMQVCAQLVNKKSFSLVLSLSSFSLRLLVFTVLLLHSSSPSRVCHAKYCKITNNKHIHMIAQNSGNLKICRVATAM
jgi:hypothetical protein